jgi:hypothetical protein
MTKWSCSEEQAKSAHEQYEGLDQHVRFIEDMRAAITAAVGPEVDALLAHVDDAGRVLGQVCVAVTLTPDESLAEPIDHAAVDAMLSMKAKRDGWQRAADNQARLYAAECTARTEERASREQAEREVKRLREELADARAVLSEAVCHEDTPNETLADCARLLVLDCDAEHDRAEQSEKTQRRLEQSALNRLAEIRGAKREANRLRRSLRNMLTGYSHEHQCCECGEPIAPPPPRYCSDCSPGDDGDRDAAEEWKANAYNAACFAVAAKTLLASTGEPTPVPEPAPFDLSEEGMKRDWERTCQWMRSQGMHPEELLIRAARGIDAWKDTSRLPPCSGDCGSEGTAAERGCDACDMRDEDPEPQK